ncbi:MAG: glycosyltransferase [Ferruginibacter sp.]|nr:glycosyltransferase [Ferruginibacter sp.]
MKVAFLGNVNNHPFIVCKHLRDKGAETVFFVEADINNTLLRPESTGLVQYPYPGWIKEVPQFRSSLVMHLPAFFAKKIIRQINECDAVIMNDYAHRIIPHLRKGIIKICMFTGGDLEIMADYENVQSMKLTNPKLKYFPAALKKAYARYSVKQLRDAIRQTDLVGYFPFGLSPVGDKILNEIFEGHAYPKYNHWCIMLDGMDYIAPTQNKKIRILNVARFMWKEPFPAGRSSNENKRNDIMIAGLGRFLKEYPEMLDIHFIEKGLHVQESKELIEQYGFSASVTWHSEMPLIKLLDEINKADIVFDQLGDHLIGGGIIAMAKGRPLIANARPEILKQISEGEIPVCHSTNADEVYEWLKKLVFDEKLRIDVGAKSSSFAFNFMDIKNESEYYYNFIQEKMNKTTDKQL